MKSNLQQHAHKLRDRLVDQQRLGGAALVDDLLDLTEILLAKLDGNFTLPSLGEVGTSCAGEIFFCENCKQHKPLDEKYPNCEDSDVCNACADQQIAEEVEVTRLNLLATQVPKNLDNICLNCGKREGDHAVSDDSCPTDESGLRHK